MGATKTKFYKNKFASEFIFIKFCAPQKSFRKRNDFCSAKKIVSQAKQFFCAILFRKRNKIARAILFRKRNKIAQKVFASENFFARYARCRRKG